MTLVLLIGVLAVAAASPPAGDRGAEGWVVLPLQEYRALRDRAHPPDIEPSPAPVEATLTRVDYDLRAQGDSATGVARLTIDVLGQGWVRVGIPPGLLVRGARLDDRPAPLVDAGRGKAREPQVLLSRVGRAVVELDVTLPVTTASGTETLVVPGAGASLTRVTVVVPRRGVEAVLAGGFLADRGESEAETRFTAHGRPGEALSLSWRRKAEEERTAQPLRFRGSVTELVALGEDGAQISADVGVEVVSGTLSSLELSLPEGLVVNEVSGSLVGDWDFRPGVLRVDFIEPVIGSSSLLVLGEARLPREGRIAIPLLQLGAAERETGGVAVEVVGAGEIREREPQGLEPADPTDLGGRVAERDSPSLVAFRFRPNGAKRSLTVALARYTPEPVLLANVEEARYRVLLSKEGKSLVQARYAVRNNQRSFLSLRLPQGAALWSASVSGRAVRPGRSDGGDILLPLEKGGAAEDPTAFPVEVVYLDRRAEWQREGHVGLPVPALDLPVSRTGVVVHYPMGYRLAVGGGELREQPYAPPSSEAFRLAPAPRALGVDKRADRQKAERNSDALQGLVDRYQKEARSGRVAGVLPVEVAFPAFGPSLYLAGELTAEGRAPDVDLVYRQTKGGRR
jgi:hypothetical protein